MKKYFFYLLLALFTNCGTKVIENQQINIDVFDTIQIPINENFNPDLSRVQQYSSDSGEYLVLQNKTDFEIRIFNIETKREAFTVPLKKEGPNGLGLINGFNMISKDTIFIAAIPPKIHLINFLGEKLSTIKIEDPEKKANYLSSNNETPLLYSNGILYGIQPYFQDLYNLGPSELKESRPIFTVKSTPNGENKIEWLSIRRPDDEWDNGKKSLDLSWNDHGDTILISPQLDHRMWIISKSQKKVIGYKSIKSNQINGFRIIENSPVGDAEIIKDLENGRYELLLFDKFRKVHYRFFYPGIDYEFYNLTPRSMMQNHPRIGVIVFDESLNILGEHIFETNYIQAWNYFVGRKGLYVSTNNPNRNDFDENFLRYDIIRFEGLNYED